MDEQISNFALVLATFCTRVLLVTLIELHPLDVMKQ